MAKTDFRQIVFIDARVPDIGDLLSGLQPDEQAFVLDPGSDGLQQIADILADNNLTDLSSISIVGHGALPRSKPLVGRSSPVRVCGRRSTSRNSRCAALSMMLVRAASPAGRRRSNILKRPSASTSMPGAG